MVAKGESMLRSKGYGFTNKEQAFANSPKPVFDVCFWRIVLVVIGIFINFIGVSEILGAIALIVPMLINEWTILTPIVAICLGLI